MSRAGIAIVLASATLLACTFTRSLDYLQAGDEETDGGTSSSGSTTSSTSSGGTDGGDAGTVGSVIISAQFNPANLVQDGANLYWTTDDNRVMTCPKPGGTPQELAKLNGDVGSITGMTLDPQDGTLFLLAEGGVKALSRGQAPVDFLPGPDVSAIAADETFLFVLSNETTAGPVLRRYPKANASQPTVISPSMSGQTAGDVVVVYKDSVYWAVQTADDVGILYEQTKTVGTGVTPKMWKHTGLNSDKEPVGIYPSATEGLAVDDDGVYWIDALDLVPYRLLRTQMQADAPALLNVTKSSATAITVDANYMYVLDGANVVRISKANTDERTAYRADDTGTEILNDSTALYYVFTGDGVKATGGIVRIPKP